MLEKQSLAQGMLSMPWTQLVFRDIYSTDYKMDSLCVKQLSYGYNYRGKSSRPPQAKMSLFFPVLLPSMTEQSLPFHSKCRARQPRLRTAEEDVLYDAYPDSPRYTPI